MSLQRWWHIVWTSFVGLFIGIIPGAGASIAAFVAYQQSRLWSKQPELYGTGIPEGVIAPEAANNGVTSGTLVPTLALGVPGGSTAAVMMIVLQYHGVVMGPRLFVTNPEVAYGVFVSMAVAYIFMIFTILPLARYMSRIVLIETTFLAPVIVLMTIVAAFGERQYLFDMGLALVVRRDRLHRPQDELPRDGDPDRHHPRAAVRAIPGARAAHLAGRLDDPVLLDARQHAVGAARAFARAALPGAAIVSARRSRPSSSARSGDRAASVAGVDRRGADRRTNRGGDRKPPSSSSADWNARSPA